MNELSTPPKPYSIKRGIVGEKGLSFSASPEFLQKIGYSQKRWGMLYSGKLEPTVEDLQRVSAYFNVPVENFFEDKSLFKKG
jgi:transcriptional regulator with XRE-family HTH domain